MNPHGPNTQCPNTQCADYVKQQRETLPSCVVQAEHNVNHPGQGRTNCKWLKFYQRYVRQCSIRTREYIP